MLNHDAIRLEVAKKHRHELAEMIEEAMNGTQREWLMAYHIAQAIRFAPDSTLPDLIDALEQLAAVQEKEPAQ